LSFFDAVKFAISRTFYHESNIVQIETEEITETITVKDCYQIDDYVKDQLHAVVVDGVRYYVTGEHRELIDRTFHAYHHDMLETFMKFDELMIVNVGALNIEMYENRKRILNELRKQHVTGPINTSFSGRVITIDNDLNCDRDYILEAKTIHYENFAHGYGRSFTTPRLRVSKEAVYEKWQENLKDKLEKNEKTNDNKIEKTLENEKNNRQ